MADKAEKKETRDKAAVEEKAQVPPDYYQSIPYLTDDEVLAIHQQAHEDLSSETQAELQRSPEEVTELMQERFEPPPSETPAEEESARPSAG